MNLYTCMKQITNGDLNALPIIMQTASLNIFVSPGIPSKLSDIQNCLSELFCGDIIALHQSKACSN